MEECQRWVSSREFSEWMVYYELDPFGEERGDLRAGIVASTIANANRDPKKRRKAFTPADFMPKFEEKSKPGKDWKGQLSLVEMLNAAFGGADKRKGKAAK